MKQAYGFLNFPILISAGFAITLFFVNCDSFQALKSKESASSSRFNFDGCSDQSKEATNKVYILGASEYLNIAEDLFPNVNQGDLVKLTNALPVVPDLFDGNLELKDYKDFILERTSLVEYFARKLTEQAASICTELNKSCRTNIVNLQISNVFRRFVSSGEMSELVEKNMDLSFENFARLIFYSPDFHFKIYSNELTSYEFISKISMALFGTFPPADLVNQRDEVFSNRQALRAELLKIFNQPKNARRFSKRFWEKWLSNDGLRNMEIPSSESFDKEAVMNDFYNKVEEAIVSEKSLKDLFYSASSSDGEIPASLLTHPSFAMSSSRVVNGKVKSHYVHRGINITNKLLCMKLPPLEPATLEQLEEAKAASANQNFADAIAQHRSNPNCRSCHSIIDPVGVTLEHLSPFGKFRDEFSDGSSILSKGVFLNKPYSDLGSLVEVISESGELRSCFVSQLKGLGDGPDNRILGPCDAKEIFSQNRERPIIDVLTEMFSSRRFTKSSLTAEQVKMKLIEVFVGDLYRYGLGREPDSGGFEGWFQVYLKTGMLPVIKGILLSGEMNKLGLNQEQFAGRSFRSLTGRTPNSIELAESVRKLIEVGKDKYLENLLNSEEVSKRFKILKQESI
jgi:hypothetical protein